LIPTPSSTYAWTNHAGHAQLGFVAADQVTFLIHALDPVDVFDYWPSRDEFSGHAVDDERVAALIHVEKQLSRLAFHGQIEQNAFVGRVPVPNIVRNLLVMPFQLSRIRIQRHNTIRVEISSAAGV